MQCAVLSISYCKETQERRAGIQAKDSYLYGNKVNLSKTSLETVWEFQVLSVATFSQLLL